VLLAIDVGNTNMMFALHDGRDVVAEWRCRTERQRTADEYWVWLLELMRNRGITARIERVVISSVVPQVVFNLRVLSDRYFETRPLVVGKPEVNIGPKPRVDPTAVVGADRSARSTATAAISSWSISGRRRRSTSSVRTAPTRAG
jgi:type III pantothenate kinase